MIEIDYKQGIETHQFDMLDNGELLKCESEVKGIKCYQQIFADFTNEFQSKQTDTYIELLSKLCHIIFENQSDFNMFIKKSTNSLLIFFQQCSKVLDVVSNKDKEIILLNFKEMINNISFSTMFSDFKGDLMLVDLYQKISENVDECILEILYKMKLSSEFPISIFKDHFINDINNFKFILLFINHMDNSQDVNALFQEFVQFPPPQTQSFPLYCKTIIYFFQHSLDEQVFVESNYYDLICSKLDSNLSDEYIGLFLQITARLLNYDEILKKTHPDLLFFLLKTKKSKSILVPVMTIIEREINMNSSEFIDEFIDEKVIFVLFNNLQNEIFTIRVRSMCLLNLLIEKSNHDIFPLLFEQEEHFLEIITNIIMDLLSADVDDIITSTLELAYRVFIYIQKPKNIELMRDLLILWNKYKIDEIIQNFAISDSKIAEHAQILNQLIKNTEESYILC